MTAAEADLEGRSDPEVLEFAATQGRILVSHDTSTMPVTFRSECARVGRVQVFYWSANALPWDK